MSSGTTGADTRPVDVQDRTRSQDPITSEHTTTPDHRTAVAPTTVNGCVAAPSASAPSAVSRANGGPAAARNTGLRVARGRYVALLDGDDMYMPRYLEALVTRLERDELIDVAFPNALLFGAPPLSGTLFQDRYPPREPITFERLLTRESNVFVSAVLKRNLVLAVGMFDERLPPGQPLPVVRPPEHLVQ